MSCSGGEILGPLFVGIITYIFNFEITGIIVAFSSFLYGIIYLFGSGIIFPKRVFSNSQLIMLNMKSVSTDDKSSYK